MNGLFGDLQSFLLLALGVAALGLGAFALIDALRHDPQAYAVEGKRTKTFWLIVLGVCLAVLIISVGNVLNLFGLLAVVGAGVYLADVRPAVNPYTARKKKDRRAGGSGPHGSW